MKKLVLALLVLLLVSVSFAACGEGASSGAESGTGEAVTSSPKVGVPQTGNKKVDEDIRNNPDIKAGGEVSAFTNKEGDAQFTYKNPDGTGGGGIIMD